MSTDELALRDGEDALARMDFGMVRTPEEILGEAQRAARALKAVIDAKPKKVMMGGEVYLEFEDWQTVGAFYGIAPRCTASRYVEYGGAQGWEADAEAVHIATGRVRSSAQAMCLNDEERWCARAKYVWAYVKKSGGTSVEDPGRDELVWEKGNDGKNRPKKEHILIGSEAVPLFQLRSMAQTRAMAKVMRNALAWIIVLQGYKPTPAEEMPDGPGPERATRTVVPETGEIIDAPARQDDATERLRLLEQAATDVKYLALTEAQQRVAWAKCVGHNVSEDAATLAQLQALARHYETKIANVKGPVGPEPDVPF